MGGYSNLPRHAGETWTVTLLLYALLSSNIALQLSQRRELRIELYGFRLRALKIRRHTLLGTLSISVVDVLRSELAHQSQQQQQVHSLSPINNRNSLNSSRRSLSNRNSIGSFQAQLQKSDNGGGVVHTAWYPTQQKSGLFGRREEDSNNNGTGKAAAVGVVKKRGTAAAVITAASNNNGSSHKGNSYVSALSARGPREDLDVPQIRLTLTVTPVTAASLVARAANGGGPSSPARVASGK